MENQNNLQLRPTSLDIIMSKEQDYIIQNFIADGGIEATMKTPVESLKKELENKKGNIYKELAALGAQRENLEVLEKNLNLQLLQIVALLKRAEKGNVDVKNNKKK